MTRSAKEWEKFIAEQLGSGKSQEVFCRERGVAPSSFQYWKKKLKPYVEARLPAIERKPERVSRAELEFPGGVRLRMEW